MLILTLVISVSGFFRLGPKACGDIEINIHNNVELVTVRVRHNFKKPFIHKDTEVKDILSQFLRQWILRI